MRCEECGVLADEKAEGWRGYRSDDPRLNQPPKLSWYCPLCAEGEFGPSRDARVDQRGD